MTNFWFGKGSLKILGLHQKKYFAKYPPPPFFLAPQLAVCMLHEQCRSKVLFVLILHGLIFHLQKLISVHISFMVRQGEF